MSAGRGNGNLLSHWVPIGAVLVALGAAFSAGAVYATLQAELDAHVELVTHPGMEARAETIMAELSTIKAMVARIDERTKRE